MPRRPRLGNRAAIEAALPAQLRQALEVMRETFDVVDWRCTPLFQPFALAAVVNRAAELVQRHGYTAARAQDVAARRLGLHPSAVRAWGDRWPQLSRAHVAQGFPSHRRRSLTMLVEDAADALPPDEAA